MKNRHIILVMLSSSTPNPKHSQIKSTWRRDGVGVIGFANVRWEVSIVWCAIACGFLSSFTFLCVFLWFVPFDGFFFKEKRITKYPKKKKKKKQDLGHYRPLVPSQGEHIYYYFFLLNFNGTSLKKCRGEVCFTNL